MDTYLFLTSVCGADLVLCRYCTKVHVSNAQNLSKYRGADDRQSKGVDTPKPCMGWWGLCNAKACHLLLLCLGDVFWKRACEALDR